MNEAKKEQLITEGAILLSKKEYEAYKSLISPCDSFRWWLRSPGNSDKNVMSVYGVDGSVDNRGCYVDRELGVRPALLIENLEFTNFGIGDKFIFGEHSFTIISKYYALCDDVIGKCAFKKDITVPNAVAYKTSDVKKYIDDWFENTKAINNVLLPIPSESGIFKDNDIVKEINEDEPEI